MKALTKLKGCINMDIFFAYLLIGTATPLFLWKESRKLAIFQIPVIVLMWTTLVLYMYSDFGTGHILFGAMFAANIIIAHLTVLYVLYTSKVPFLFKSETDEDYIH